MAGMAIRKWLLRLSCDMGAIVIPWRKEFTCVMGWRLLMPRTRCSCFGRGAGEVGNLLQQFLFLEWFAEIRINPQFQGIVAVLLGRARSNHQNWQLVQLGVAAYLFGQFESIHARHLDV